MDTSTSQLRKTQWQALFAILFLVSFLTGSMIPQPPHISSALETIEQHHEFIEDHGHSHGFEEDLFAALHGHSHDVIEHDHSKVTFFSVAKAAFVQRDEDKLPSYHSRLPQGISFEIDRPPRV